MATFASFASFNLAPGLVEACEKLKYVEPTDIQKQAIPYALQGRDIIGLAQTGSGKTAAFALPILHALLEAPQKFFACVLAPSRELALQISEQFTALGSVIGVKCVVLIGGEDMQMQAVALAREPHILVCTPGRLVDHLENTKGFQLSKLKFLVMDEADRLLNMDFEKEIEKILKVIPVERRTFLFSATMTSKVAKLQRASLRNPVRIEVSAKYQTVDTLSQSWSLVPAKMKDAALAQTLRESLGSTVIVFVGTCANAQRLTFYLHDMQLPAIPLHGQLSQTERIAALSKFKAGKQRILLATDVASRGLDIPAVDLVLNYDVPQHSKDYIHRVGRTARAGRSGRAITFVTQYDVEMFCRIEELLGLKMPQVELNREAMNALLPQSGVAQASAISLMKHREEQKKARKERKFDKK